MRFRANESFNVEVGNAGTWMTGINGVDIVIFCFYGCVSHGIHDCASRVTNSCASCVSNGCASESANGGWHDAFDRRGITVNQHR